MLRSIKKIQLLLRAFILLRIYLQIYLPLQYFESNLELSISIQIRYIFRKEFILKGSLAYPRIICFFKILRRNLLFINHFVDRADFSRSNQTTPNTKTPDTPQTRLPRNISNPRTIFYEETISHNPANIEPLDTPQTSQLPTSRLPTQPF